MFHELFVYPGIVVSMFLAGTLTPLPEEIVLLSIGYGASTHAFHLFPALFAAMLGALLGDATLFGIVRHGGAYADRLYRMFTYTKSKKVRRMVAREDTFPMHYIVVSRFIVGVRSLGPVLAAHHAVSWTRFLLWDSLAVALYVPTVFFLGFHFHHTVLRLFQDAELLRHVLFGAVLVFLALYILTRWIGPWRESKG